MHFGLEISTKNLKRIDDIDKISKSIKHKQKEYYSPKTGELKTKDVWYIPNDSLDKCRRASHTVGGHYKSKAKIQCELSEKQFNLMQNENKLKAAKYEKFMNNKIR